jgi:WD40 repeat protein/serine/threonine protein kinase
MPRVDEIYLAALEKTDAHERSAYLDQACAGDVELRLRVDRLLRTQPHVGAFLESPAPELAPTVKPSVAGPGAVIGPYKLLQQIGEGGMGAVYMAEQTHPVQRKVALKLIRQGYDTRSVIARFEAERQALALMDHPNIARVLDAGASELGQPYFVMELVHGVPITKYCDERRLTLQQRLELFVPVCHAVQHAHQKGIIHRDLKPSNVLIAQYDGRPVPKVIDFGVAKATGPKLTDKTMFTEFGSIIGTLEYMSPEQAEFNQLDIDTRSDVYSLGVLLYELLTGTTPLDKRRLKSAAIMELLRVIKEEEPPKPSTRLSTAEELPSIAANRNLDPLKLSRLVQGDLDWIVMKALEKDRNRRYETANGFAADVLHYLADEPVQASPPSTMYRLRKFVRRNRGPVAAVCAVFVVLIAGIIGTSWGLRWAFAEKQRADSNANQANINARQASATAEREREEKLRADREAKAAVAAAVRERQERDRADAKEKLVRRHLYAARLNLIQNAWENNRVAGVPDLLAWTTPQSDEEDLRAFEWYYWNRLCHSSLLDLKGHTGPVNSVAYSSDGSRIASGGHDQSLRVWDAVTGQELLSLKGHSAHISKVAYGANGARIASASDDGLVILWDGTTGDVLQRFHGPVGSGVAMALSLDGKRLAYGGGTPLDREKPADVTVWNAMTGQEVVVLKGHKGGITSLAFSPDRQRLATSGWDLSVKIWDITTEQELLTLKAREFEIPRTDSAGRQELIRMIVNHAPARSMAFSPDGQRLATAGVLTIHLFDAKTGEEQYTLRGHSGALNGIAFSQDGLQLASASRDQTVKIWHTISGEELFTIRGHTTSVYSVAFSPDGRRVVSAGGDSLNPLAPGSVKVWDATNPQEALAIGGADPGGRTVAFDVNGRRLVTAGFKQTVKLRDAVTGEELFDLKGHSGDVVSAAFSPNGAQVASASRDKTVKLWDANTGQELFTLKGHSAGVNAVAFSRDGERLASGSNEGAVKLWKPSTGELLRTLKGHASGVFGVAFDRNGERIASASFDRTVKIWDPVTGQESLTLTGHTGGVLSVAFSPDGNTLASASYDRSVRIWDLTSGQERLSLTGHTGPVWCVAFSHDGRRLASGAFDETVKLWDVATGQEPLTLKGKDAPIFHLAFSPDGQRLAAAYGIGIRVWHAALKDSATK